LRVEKLRAIWLCFDKDLMFVFLSLNFATDAATLALPNLLFNIKGQVSIICPKYETIKVTDTSLLDNHEYIGVSHVRL
jgi:hypothetical protein